MPRASFLSVLTREDRKRWPWRVSTHTTGIPGSRSPRCNHFGRGQALDPGEIDNAGPLCQALDQRLRLARYLALPQYPAVAVDNEHRRLGERHVEPDENSRPTRPLLTYFLCKNPLTFEISRMHIINSILLWFSGRKVWPASVPEHPASLAKSVRETGSSGI